MSQESAGNGFDHTLRSYGRNDLCEPEAGGVKQAANSTLVRSRPPVITNMLRSRSFLKQLAATGFESATQIPPVQLIRVLLAIEVAFQTTIAVINVTVKEHLTNAFTLVPDRMIGLLLREPKCWIWFVDTDDSGMTHFHFFFFCN